MSDGSKIIGSNSNDDNYLTSRSNLTAEEATSTLEDNHCPICENVLIKACRIDCGHTFCRHCLNLHKENKNDRGKSTCFICDAAITEIINNTEKDKEIDNLYSLLSVDERLRRVRVIAERKASEEKFVTGVRESPISASDEGANGNLGSGDTGAFSLIDEDGSSNQQEIQDNYRIQGIPPVYYTPGSVMWSNRNGVEHEESESEQYDNYNYNTGGESDYCYVEGYETEHGSEDSVTIEQPQTPIVIHHTVQHVYHTVEYRNNAASQNENHSEFERTRVHRNCINQAQRNSDSDEPMASCREWNERRNSTYNSQTSYAYASGHNPRANYPQYRCEPSAYPHSSNYTYSPSHIPGYYGSYEMCTPSLPVQPMYPSVTTRLPYSNPAEMYYGSRDPQADYYNNELNACSSCHSCGCESFERDNVSERPSSRQAHFYNDETVGEVNISGERFTELGSRYTCECHCGQNQSESESDDQSIVEEITVNVTIPMPLTDSITVTTIDRGVRDHGPSTYAGYSSSH